jgi:hypothetical protein
MQRRWLEKKPAPKPQESITQVVNRTVNLFDQNQKIAAAICQLYATRSLFFLQPNAKYNSPARLYRRSLPEEFVAEATLTIQSSSFYGRA